MPTKRDLGQVEPFAQEIDADQDVEDAGAQIAQNRDAFERIDLAVQIADAQSVLEQIVGEILGHLLGERRHEHALLALGAQRGSLP